MHIVWSLSLSLLLSRCVRGRMRVPVYAYALQQLHLDVSFTPIHVVDLLEFAPVVLACFCILCLHLCFSLARSLIFCFFRCMCRSIQCFVAFRCIAVVCVNVRKRERRMNQMTRFQRRPSCQNSFVYVCWCVRVCVRPCLCMSVAF